MELIFEGKLLYQDEYVDDWGGVHKAQLEGKTEEGKELDIGSKIAGQIGEVIPRSCFYSKGKYRLTIQLCLEEMDE